jgi:hypothetical protein
MIAKVLCQLCILIIVGAACGLLLPSPLSIVASFILGGTIGLIWNDVWDKFQRWLRN